MANKYNQLNIKEREFIQIGLWEGKSLREIARELDRHPSTISRELKRNIRGGTKTIHTAHGTRKGHGQNPKARGTTQAQRRGHPRLRHQTLEGKRLFAGTNRLYAAPRPSGIFHQSGGDLSICLCPIPTAWLGSLYRRGSADVPEAPA